MHFLVVMEKGYDRVCVYSVASQGAAETKISDTYAGMDGWIFSKFPILNQAKN